MIKFKDYIWLKIRRAMLITWITLSMTTIAAYTGTMIFQKNKQLTASLRVAANTIYESMEAGDWSLALNHLMMLEKNGPIFNIQLATKIESPIKLTGPFGTKPFGIGYLCKMNPVADSINLSGCMMLFGGGEIITLVLFILLASTLSFLLLIIFNNKSLKFVERISNELKQMRELSHLQNLHPEDQIAEIASIREYILLLLHEAKEASKSIAVSQLSAQVAHDIRSPLAVLDLIINDIKDFPENKRFLIKNAIRRIHDIANNLLRHYMKKQNKTYDSKIETESFLITMLDPIFSEKCLQYKHLKIQFELIVSQDSYTIFSRVNRIEFMRMVSNLIDNAVESISHQNGHIIVSLNKESETALIKISDNGCGIPQCILSKLTTNDINDISFGKNNGHGLGLSQAYSAINSWNGHFDIQTKINHGSIITIKLPLSTPPAWLISIIQIKLSQTIVILDDDLSIHDAWRQRLNFFISRYHIKIKHFSSPNELRKFVHDESREIIDWIFLMDYEIADSIESGLDLIKTLQIQDNSILVTSHHEEQHVIDQCKKLDVRILPKSIVAFIPIQLMD